MSSYDYVPVHTDRMDRIKLTTIPYGLPTTYLHVVSSGRVCHRAVPLLQCSIRRYALPIHPMGSCGAAPSYRTGWQLSLAKCM